MPITYEETVQALVNAVNRAEQAERLARQLQDENIKLRQTLDTYESNVESVGQKTGSDK